MPAPTLATFGTDIDTLKTMLKRENDLRLGEEIRVYLDPAHVYVFAEDGRLVAPASYALAA